MSVDKLLGYEEGDIITLSDLQTQIEFDSPNADFVIKETRVYLEPNGCFKLTCYLMDSPDEQTYMLMIKQVDKETEIMLYYLDNGNVAEEMEPLLKEEDEDFIDKFEVTLHFDEKEFDVTWDKKSAGTFFGIEFNSSHNDNEELHTVSEYFTEDDCKGNNHAFVDWIGDKEEGFIELWYGCPIKPFEISIAKGE